MPIYVYACADCSTRAEVFVRRMGDERHAACGVCGSGAMQRVISAFTTKRDLASELANLDPIYRKRIDAAIANTPEADPMRLLAKLTPFSAADAPGDPVSF